MNAPKLRKLIGEITGISQLDSTPVTLITIQDASGDIETVSTSNQYWKAVGRFFQPGSIVSCEAEVRVKDTTEYTDASGATKKHTSAGLNLSKIQAYSQAAWARELLTSKQVGDLQALNAVEETRVNAVAAYLGTTFASFK